MPQHRLTQDQFISKSREIHGDTYDYTKTEYNLSKDKVIITCKIHGDFEQKASAHLKGNRCIKCSRLSHRLSQQYFLTKSLEIHGDKYDYSQVVYNTYYVPIKLICKVHGEFLIKPGDHLRGSGCIKCGKQQLAKIFKLSENDFIDRAVKVHGDKYDYSKVIYKNNREKVEIICRTHNLTFWQSPFKHWAGQKCFKCSHHKKFSYDALDWLYSMEVVYKTKIQHIANGGEFAIPGTRYKADGYSQEHNIVFEYYGNAYHGNPLVYDRDKVFVKNYKTYGDMYDYTMKREEEIRHRGFEIVTIWERDWHRTVKSIIKIQRLFRKRRVLFHESYETTI